MGTPRATLFFALAPFLAAALALGIAPSAAPQPPATQAGERVEAGWALAWLTRLQSEAPGREAGSRAHARGVAFIASTLRSLGAEEVVVEGFKVRGVEVKNVIGVIRGRSRARVVLAAHHDVVSGAPGAIDDGGGIAAIFAAARALLAGPPPPCDVEIAIFDGEEWGCIGSRAHLVMTPDTPIRAALAVELVGWRQDRPVVHTLPYGFAWEAKGVAPAWVPQAVRRAGRGQQVGVGFGDPAFSPWYQATVRILKLRTGSDAGAYSEAGFPAAMLTGSSLTNFYDGYHQPSDAMAKVSGARLDDAARVIAASAWELGAEPAPTMELGVPSLSFGNRTFGPLALALIGILAAFASASGALIAKSEAHERAQVALGLCLLAFGLQGSIVGLLCFVPLVSASLLASTWPRGRFAFLALGMVPLVIELLLILGASLAFGFGWRGEVLETAALLIALWASYVLIRRANPAPVPAAPVPSVSGAGQPSA